MSTAATINPLGTSMFKGKYKYFADIESDLIACEESASMNFIDAFYWGYLSCLYDTTSPSVLLDKISKIVGFEAEKMITVNDKYNIYLQLLQSLSIDIKEYIEKKMENPDSFPNLLKPSTVEEEKLSEELIKQLKAEEEAENQRIRERLDELENNKATCPICLEGLTEKDFFGLDRCNHLFHVDCLREYAKRAIDSRKFPLNCPSEKCKNALLDGDLAEFMEPEYIDKFNDFYLQTFVDQNAGTFTWCPTPNCKFVFEPDPNVPEFRCGLCQKHYCLECRVEYHTGMTCKEYRISNKFDANDKKFLAFVRGRMFKQCPKCKFWVEKTEGCAHMVCRCSNEFCYVCGGPYPNCHCKEKQAQRLAQPRMVHGGHRVSSVPQNLVRRTNIMPGRSTIQRPTNQRAGQPQQRQVLQMSKPVFKI